MEKEEAVVLERESGEEFQSERESEAGDCGASSVTIFFMRGLMRGRRSIGFRRISGRFCDRFPAA